jgi:hypothetical protein
MNDLDLSSNFYVQWSANKDFSSGEIFHIKRNTSGGSLLTPVARFFITNARIPAEGYFPHQRLDCFVSNTQFVSEPEQLAKDLFKALRNQDLIDEPTWLSWHVAEEQGGTACGAVFDFD